MIKVENGETYGWEAAIRGMRNPMNSWDKSDSGWKGEIYYVTGMPIIEVGEKDLELMKKLIAAGTDHSKFMRMIGVSLDIVAPLYWWKEFDTYKVGTVADSCSTMHKIHAKEFELEDFSYEHLYDTSRRLLLNVIDELNVWRDNFLIEKDDAHKKKFWWQLIQLLPSSYNQRRTITLNYAVLRNMYHSRKNHKLNEWRDFCKWIEKLPYSELITEG